MFTRDGLQANAISDNIVLNELDGIASTSGEDDLPYTRSERTICNKRRKN